MPFSPSALEGAFQFCLVLYSCFFSDPYSLCLLCFVSVLVVSGFFCGTEMATGTLCALGRPSASELYVNLAF